MKAYDRFYAWGQMSASIGFYSLLDAGAAFRMKDAPGFAREAFVAGFVDQRK